MTNTPYLSLNFAKHQGLRAMTARDIVAIYQTEINAHVMAYGLRVVPVRVLAEQLGISKNTVHTAYEELVERGVLESRPRLGFYVASKNNRAATKSSLELPRPRLRDAVPVPQRKPSSERTHLSCVLIDPQLLPLKRMGECVRAVMQPHRLEPYYDAQGYRPLRQWIAKRLTSRGMKVDADEVILTTGSQQAIDLVARALKGSTVALEDPVYAYARRLFQSHHKKLALLTFSPFEALPLDAWKKTFKARRPQLVYAITSYQNPTGFSYSTSEMQALLEMARDTECAVLEDDWGSDMLSGSAYRGTLRAMGGDAVLYVNSFTKKLWPGLRIGYLVAARELIPSLMAAKRLSTLGNPWLTEAALSEFLDRGYYDTHLKRMQTALDQRYSDCLAGLTELMPEGVRWTKPGGGPTLWLELPARVRLDTLARTLRAQKIEIENGDESFAKKPHLHGFRISYAFVPEPQLRHALRALAEAIKVQLLRRTSGGAKRVQVI